MICSLVYDLVRDQPFHGVHHLSVWKDEGIVQYENGDPKRLRVRVGASRTGSMIPTSRAVAYGRNESMGLEADLDIEILRGSRIAERLTRSFL